MATFQFIQTAVGSIDWWVFDLPDYGAVAGKIGLRVRNPSSGSITFDSRMKYMRVVGAINGDTHNGLVPAAASFPGVPAIVGGNMPYYYNIIIDGGPTGPGGGTSRPWTEGLICPFASVSGGQVTWISDHMEIPHPASEPITTSPSQQESYNFLVVDVSNL